MEIVNKKEEEVSSVVEETKEASMSKEKEVSPTNEESANDVTDMNWEEMFTNEQGRLTRIANPELIDKLRPYLEGEYKRLSVAYNIIEEFYKERFPKMEFKNWSELFDQINWERPYYTPEDESNKEGKQKTKILRVTFPDGSIVQEKKVSNTLVSVVKYAGAKEVQNLNINTCGNNMIVSEPDINPRYAIATKPVENNLYVNTCSDTPTKYEIINKISEDLDLNLQVDFVSVNENEVIINKSEKQIRKKIKVTFPNEEIIQHSKVLDTLLEVVQYAGIENARNLNIRMGKDNLITDHIIPKYAKALKPFGKFYVNTNSSTTTKYEQMIQISEGLNLNLIIELVDDNS